MSTKENVCTHLTKNGLFPSQTNVGSHDPLPLRPASSLAQNLVSGFDIILTT